MNLNEQGSRSPEFSSGNYTTTNCVNWALCFVFIEWAAD